MGKQKILRVVAIYDNGGETIDRYTVYTNVYEGRGTLECLCMSDFPDHPQGVSMFSNGMLGAHNGRSVPFDSLPANVRLHAYSRLRDGDGPLYIGSNAWVPTPDDHAAAALHRREHSLYYAIGGLS